MHVFRKLSCHQARLVRSASGGKYLFVRRSERCRANVNRDARLVPFLVTHTMCQCFCCHCGRCQHDASHVVELPTSERVCFIGDVVCWHTEVAGSLSILEVSGRMVRHMIFNNICVSPEDIESSSFESFSFVHSMITISTVGYGDILPSSDSERAHEICTMILGCGWFWICLW